MVLSQLTRAPAKEDRDPQFADLRESGAIEQDADIVLFINRPSLYTPDALVKIRQKQNSSSRCCNGPIGNLDFVFLGHHTRFEQALPDAWSSGGEE